ncbi:DUF222 domain-containing protein [Rhodococcoides kroppenstedtii]|uniref:DUF222 domain-containing protein n=1 Tax=Rhodococcoides kroppenstedtii TaxID=293050 RepID=UPI003632D950
MSDRGVGAVSAAQVGGVPWSARDHAAVGLPVSFDIPVSGHLDALVDLAAGAGYLEWRRYRHAAALHTELVVPEEDRDERAVDAYAQCAARIATALSVSQYVAERLLDNAVALRDRLPRVFECLRDGVVSPSYIRTIVSRTELIHGRPYQGLVDADIAAALRKPGSWSTARVRDLCDQMVYRRDPDAVRERREEAMKGRCFFTEAGLDGMGTVGATMSAERAAIVARVVERLASQVCRHDSRSKTARASDALFALVKHAPFGCDCARHECAFTVVDADEVAATAARIVIHVVTDTTTLTGPVPAPAADTDTDTTTDTDTDTTAAAHPQARHVDTTAAAAVQGVADEVTVEEPVVDELAADGVPVDEAAVDEAAAEPELVDGVGFVAGLGIISGATSATSPPTPTRSSARWATAPTPHCRRPNRPIPTGRPRHWTPTFAPATSTAPGPAATSRRGTATSTTSPNTTAPIPSGAGRPLRPDSARNAGSTTY